MKKRLDKPDDEVYRAVQEQFGFSVSKLEFVPLGESSWLYRASTENDKLVAIKIQNTDNPAVDEARRQLAEQNYAYSPKTYLTSGGKFQGRIGELYISVEDYVAHTVSMAYDAEPDEPYLVTLGKALKELHSLEAPNPENCPIPAETFHSRYLEPAQSALTNFKDWAADKSEAQPILDVLSKNDDVIQAIFSRNTELGARLANRQSPLVLTHGDVHFANILESTSGGFYLIDWDHTLLALPAHDLMYFSDSQLRTISKGYGADLLANKDELNYYRNHLMVRAVWFWLNRAMSVSSMNELENVSRTISFIFDGSPYLLRALG